MRILFFQDFRHNYKHDNDGGGGLSGPERWFSVHQVWTKQSTTVYLNEIKAWMDAHPREMLIIWFSWWGSENDVGQEQYEDVSMQQKQDQWSYIKSVFTNPDGSSMLMSNAQLQHTPIRTLLNEQKRIAVFMSDYSEFTGGDGENAIDARESLLNEVQVQSDNFAFTQEQLLKSLSAGEEKARGYQANGQYWLMQLGASAGVGGKGNGFAYFGNAIPQLQLLSETGLVGQLAVNRNLQECISAYGIPGLQYCPPTLLTMAALTNYYVQKPLAHAAREGWTLPNAFYADGIGPGGTLRTATQSIDAGGTTGDCSQVLLFIIFICIIVIFECSVVGLDKLHW